MYRIKNFIHRKTACILIVLATTSFLFGQQQELTKLDSNHVVEIQKMISEHLEVKNETLIWGNQNGLAIRLIGSDNVAVIDLLGKVNQPLQTKSVNLLFHAERLSDRAFAEIPIKNFKVSSRTSKTKKNTKPFVIPSLREWQGDEGFFFVTPNSKIIIDSNDSHKIKDVATLLQQDLKKRFNRHFAVAATGKAKKGDIIIRHCGDTSLGAEGYKMDIGNFIIISAPAHAGRVFATRTLLQLFGEGKLPTPVVKGKVRDYPAYPVRGMLLDVGRKFFSMDFLLDYVEILSYYKMSNFQIHLNDNAFHKYYEFDWEKTPSGFRLESNAFPQLPSPDGYYTKKQFRELQHKAHLYGLEIIPEIDVPAHSLAIVKAVPTIGSTKYGRDHLDIENPQTYDVVTKIFDEYIGGEDPVFVGKHVHIGTDEYDKKDAESFRRFTDFLIKFVQRRGKQVRAWGALSHAKGVTPVRSEDVTLNMWYNGYADPLEMKMLGYKQISTPDSWLYIVPAAGYYYDFLHLDKIYNYWSPSVVGNVTFEKGDPTVVGGMFAIWNDIVENGITQKDVHNRAFAALQVLSEKMWSADDNNTPLAEFNSKKATVGEGPGLNIAGTYRGTPRVVLEIPFEDSVYDQSANFTMPQMAESSDFSKGAVGNALTPQTPFYHISSPVEDIGNSYSVQFFIKLKSDSSQIKFTSSTANFQINSHGISFDREGYSYPIEHDMLLQDWMMITVVGNVHATKLFVNGKLVKNLDGETILMPYKDNAGKKISFKMVQTLTFPLRHITLQNSDLDELKVYNFEVSNSEILHVYRNYLQQAN